MKWDRSLTKSFEKICVDISNDGIIVEIASYYSTSSSKHSQPDGAVEFSQYQVRRILTQFLLASKKRQHLYS
jgi:hypothetical protein